MMLMLVCTPIMNSEPWLSRVRMTSSIHPATELFVFLDRGEAVPVGAEPGLLTVHLDVIVGHGELGRYTQVERRIDHRDIDRTIADMLPGHALPSPRITVVVGVRSSGSPGWITKDGITALLGPSVAVLRSR